MKPGEWLASRDPAAFRRGLLRWYRRQGRSLPWRTSRDPYAVWLSEIMLQQTQVATVLGYFERFLEHFPTVAALAAADEAEVLHLWQGLGYYRRARNLHRAAQQVAAEFGGVFPRSLEEIASLPGLGRYTANAVACFAFGRRLPILEANTIRVWARLSMAEGDPARQPLRGELWEAAEAILPHRGAADLNQALMDLGALVCTARMPNCVACPVNQFCAAFSAGAVEDYPQSAARKAVVERDDAAVVVWREDHVLVRKRPDDGPWAGLWEFPRVERANTEDWEAAALRAAREATNRPIRLIGERISLRHGIMHYRVRLKCFDAAALPETKPSTYVEHGVWTAVAKLRSLPFSSPQRRIVADVEKGRFLQSRLFGS